jgi:hypothetical protein
VKGFNGIRNRGRRESANLFEFSGGQQIELGSFGTRHRLGSITGGLRLAQFNQFGFQFRKVKAPRYALGMDMKEMRSLALLADHGSIQAVAGDIV